MTTNTSAFSRHPQEKMRKKIKPAALGCFPKLPVNRCFLAPVILDKSFSNSVIEINHFHTLSKQVDLGTTKISVTYKLF